MDFYAANNIVSYFYLYKMLQLILSALTVFLLCFSEASAQSRRIHRQLMRETRRKYIQVE